MNKAQLEKKISRLEFVQDQLQAELAYVDNLLKSVGFPNGLISAKEIALELIEQQNVDNHEDINEAAPPDKA